MELIFILFLNNAFERYSASAQAVALGHAVTASAIGNDAIRFNPAALAEINKNELMCGYEYVLSGIEGLHNINIGYARPIFNGGIGLQLSEFGFSEQKEQAITIAYGNPLSNELRFGIGADFYLINNQRTGHGFAYGLNIAFLGRLYKKWSLGVYGHNLNRPQFGSREEGELPYELRAGLGYEPFDGILSEVDFSLIEDYFRIHMAGQFRLFNMLFFRTGVKTNPQVLSFGTGIVYKFIKIDYAVEYIPELPLTHNMTIKMDF